MKNNPVASFTKVGDIYVSSCGSSQHLFPHTILPAEWPSCEDAYQYTWSLDKGKDLVAVATSDREKLARSMGFCPHNRCQLSNLTSTGVDGRCPANLCYTKLENGARSFGACCFVDGAFNSGQLIGYYNKTQHTPKPIYKKYRVILGDKTGGLDESFNSFINANEIHDRLIVTQCPLESTVLDVQQMLVEQNVTLWIQLAPYIDQDPTSPQIALTQCTMTPTIFLSTSHRMINSGNSSNHNLIRDISMEDAANINFTLPTFSAQYLNIHYRSKIRKAVQEEQKTLSTHGQSGTLDMQEAHDLSRFTENTVEHRHRVMNLWYSNWKDFAVPPTSDEQDIMAMVDRAVAVMSEGGTVVVSCLSGRGRSGTLSALILGRLHRVTTHTQLADIIVGMRERRDGMLETPQQFRFVAKLLQLPDTAACGLLCAASQSVRNGTTETHRLIFAVLTGALLVLAPMLFMLRKTRI